MERAISQEDRIRRAEEIYYRKLAGMDVPRTTMVNANSKKKYGFWKKVLVQIIISACIYGVIYQLKSNTDNFSIDSINYIKRTIAYDIDTNKIMGSVRNHIKTFSQTNDENNVIDDTITEETNSEVVEDIPTETIQPEENKIEEQSEEETTLSQMEQDAEYIKTNFSLIKPVTGAVTSRFGLRNPTTPTVPKNHTGIDLGVVEGTVFVSAMEGTVEVVSSVGDYRKSRKNNKWGCIYALCTLQNNLCIRRGQSRSRASFRRNRKYRKCNRSTFTF